jgi:hypothetical protein
LAPRDGSLAVQVAEGDLRLLMGVARRLACRAGRPDFPPVAVLRVAAGATMRQACTAAGIDPDDAIVGIPAETFER